MLPVIEPFIAHAAVMCCLHITWAKLLDVFLLVHSHVFVSTHYMGELAFYLVLLIVHDRCMMNLWKEAKLSAALFEPRKLILEASGEDWHKLARMQSVPLKDFLRCLLGREHYESVFCSDDSGDPLKLRESRILNHYVRGTQLAFFHGKPSKEVLFNYSQRSAFIICAPGTAHIDLVIPVHQGEGECSVNTMKALPIQIKHNHAGLKGQGWYNKKFTNMNGLKTGYGLVSEEAEVFQQTLKKKGKTLEELYDEYLTEEDYFFPILIEWGNSSSPSTCSVVTRKFTEEGVKVEKPIGICVTGYKADHLFADVEGHEGVGARIANLLNLVDTPEKNPDISDDDRERLKRRVAHIRGNRVQAYYNSEDILQDVPGVKRFRRADLLPNNSNTQETNETLQATSNTQFHRKYASTAPTS